MNGRQRVLQSVLRKRDQKGEGAISEVSLRTAPEQPGIGETSKASGAIETPRPAEERGAVVIALPVPHRMCHWHNCQKPPGKNYHFCGEHFILDKVHRLETQNSNLLILNSRQEERIHELEKTIAAFVQAELK